jgi:uncharacterized membrane protein
MESEPLGQELSDQDRLLVIFGYLGPLALVSLVASRREFVKWHAKQGLLVSLALVALYTILRFLRFVLSYLSDFFAELFWTAALMVGLGVLVMLLVCIVRGLEGERFKIPGLGALADLL